MIPSVQLITTNHVPIINKEVLDKFVLPITPNSSPMAAEQLNDQQQIQLLQEQQNQNANNNFLCKITNDDHVYSMKEEIISTTITPSPPPPSPPKHTSKNLIENFKCILNDDDNNIECVTSENILHKTTTTTEHVLMEVINIPITFCQTLSSASMTANTINTFNFSQSQDELLNQSINLSQTDIDIDINCMENDENYDNKMNECSENEIGGNIDDEDDDNDNDNDSSSEQELTNLGWLIDLKNLTNWSSDASVTSHKRNMGNLNGNGNGRGLGGCILDDIDDDDDGCTDPIINNRDLSEERFKKFTLQVKQSQMSYAEREDVYRKDPLEKPPFNYAQIIAMAMMDQGRMTLKEICKWIQEHFAYFRYNKNWNNSIRHNLSLHFCFTKIARDKTEKGKGGYWELSMNTAKSEKKRIRNRKKQRDECGRFSHNQRNGTLSNGTKRQNGQNCNNLKSIKAKSMKNHQSAINNENANITSNVSECSSPIASLNGTYDERCEQPIEYHNQEQTSPQQYEIVQSQNHLIDRTVQHELLNDMIVNDLVIINGNCLDSTADNLIENDFDKNDEINGSYFISSVHESSVCGSNNNESSNEIFIKGDIQLCSGDIIAFPTIKTTQADHLQSIKTSNQHHRMLGIFNTDENDQTTNECNIRNVGYCNGHIGSNVIVEPMPYSLSHMDTVIDIEHEFSSLVNMPDPELAEDGFFDYTNW